MRQDHSNFLSTIGTSDWPARPPRDLELRLLDALSYESCCPEAIWDEVAAWLQDNRLRPTPAVLARAPVTSNDLN